MASYQTAYDIYQGRGWPGQLSRVNEPCAFHRGTVHVLDADTRKPRPGDAVYYDATNNAFRLPTSAATTRQVVGILSYDYGTLVTSGTTVPAGSNSNVHVEFEDDDPVKVLVAGTVWVVAGAAVEYGQLMAQQRDDWKWNPLATATAFAGLVHAPIVCVSPVAVADNGLAEAQIGYGRVI